MLEPNAVVGQAERELEAAHLPFQGVHALRAVYGIDPCGDPRWKPFLESRAEASIFHTPEWLNALRRTYDYEPFAITTSKPGHPLQNGIVFCRVRSWLTGNRLISLPFSDHCQPLVDDADDLRTLLAWLAENRARENWKRIELRPLAASREYEGQALAFGKVKEFYFHAIDLRPDLDALFKSFHKTAVRQMIRRAEREDLVYQHGRSEELLRAFYEVLLLTRRRHSLPPQPREWFGNLLECLGDAAQLHVAYKQTRPIASILTLFYKQTLVYKYGCSDDKLHNLGGMPFLFWKAMQEGKRLGAVTFDLGRSEMDNAGLLTFKSRLAGVSSSLSYWGCPPEAAGASTSDRGMDLFQRAFKWLPDRLLVAAGRLLYRHVG